MVYIVISFVIFFITVILHIIIHNILLKFSYLNYKIFIPVFMIGFIADIYIILSYSNNSLIKSEDSSRWTEKLILTSVLLFILLSISFLVFFLSPMGEESPSSVILLSIRKARKLTRNQILSRFNDDLLIKKRLDYLITLGWIQKKEKMYSILPKGDAIAGKILIYRKLLNWKIFG